MTQYGFGPRGKDCRHPTPLPLNEPMTYPKDSWVEGVEATGANPPIDCAVLEPKRAQLSS
jgi:hypothetical protein